MKTKAYMRAVRKTQDEFWVRQDKQDKVAQLKRSHHQIDSINDAEKNFDQELNLNLKSALSQLGYKTTFLVPAIRAYAVTLTNTGWCNIDRAVFESTTDRTTLDYTDPQTGKKAVIKYSPVSFRVDNASAYDRIYLYLLPGKLSSFMRISGSDGKFSDRMDELMNYRTVCIAYKNGQAFYYAEDNIQPKDYPPFVLTKIDGSDLDRKLESLGRASQGANLKKENLFIRFDIRDQRRQDHNAALRDLTDKTIRVIFPCIPIAAPAEGSIFEYQAQ